MTLMQQFIAQRNGQTFPQEQKSALAKLRAIQQQLTNDRSLVVTRSGYTLKGHHFIEYYTVEHENGNVRYGKVVSE